jgi:3-deoxy-D-manno-octulosonic-acid transferase
VRAPTATATVTVMLDLTEDEERCRTMSEAASRFAAQHRGATVRTVERLVPIICAVA